MDEATTERGFRTVHFLDRYDARCSLQESSLATEAAIWLGIDNDNQRMHLTQAQVKNLLPYLQHFAETGFIGEW